MEQCRQCGKVLEPDAVFCPQCGASRSQGLPADSMIGRWIIGQYVVQHKLGEGGMGVVYLADQPSVGRQAVIKMLHPELLRDPTVAPRFEVEARAASQLNHPHIITIYNYGAMEDGALYLAMEYCAGQSLEHVLHKGALPPERGVRVGAMIADALAEAHRHGVVHRDLKPSNIMLEQKGRQRDFVKVLDFGIAKVEGLHMTKTGTMIGTPQYMSPEQLRGEELDGRSDLYSLGVMIYEMVTGRLPFVSETIAGFMHKHLNEVPLPPAQVAPDRGIMPALEGVILRCLEKNPAGRFQDAEELGNALEACLVPTALPLISTTPPTAAPMATPPRPSRTGMWLGIWGGILALVTVAVVAVVLLRSPSTDQDGAAGKKLAWRDPGTSTDTDKPDKPAPAIQADAAPAPDQKPAESVAAGSTRQPPPSESPSPRRKQSTSRKPRTTLAVNRMSGATHKQRPPARASQQGKGRAKGQDKPLSTVFPSLKATKQDKALGGRSVTQLERRLKRVMSTARVPPSSLTTVLDGYRRAMLMWPPDRRETLRKQYLISLLSTYERPSMQLKPHERRSVAQLKRIYLSMETKNSLSRQQREKILANVFKAYSRPNIKPADRPFYQRVALVSMINSTAADSKAVWR